MVVVELSFAVSAAGSVCRGVNCRLGEPWEDGQGYIGAVQRYDASERKTAARPQKAESIKHCV
jgi:hypothetical protein